MVHFEDAAFDHSHVPVPHYLVSEREREKERERKRKREICGTCKTQDKFSL
jgi:hypothetical protein